MMPFIFRSSVRSNLLPADTWMAKASFFGILCQIKKDAALRLYPFLFQNLKDSLRAFFLSYCPCDHNQNAKTCQYLSCCHSRRMIQNSDFMFSCFQMKSQKRFIHSFTLHLYAIYRHFKPFIKRNGRNEHSILLTFDSPLDQISFRLLFIHPEYTLIKAGIFI